MAKSIEIGLVLEEEGAERFSEYDENSEVSDELIAMFIEGKEIYEQNRRKVSCNSFSCGSSSYHPKEYANGLLKKIVKKL
jgi:hypothetical protein